MKKLLRFELRRLRKAKFFYVLTIVSLLFVVISGLTTKALNDALQENGGTAAPFSAYLFAKGALGGSYTLLLGIFVALFATEDQAGDTMKNIIAKGCGRRQIFLSKYLISLAAVLVMSLVTAAAAFAYGKSVWGSGAAVTDNVPRIVLGLTLGIAAYHALFFAISYTVGKSGSAIAMNIVVPLVVSLVLGMGDAFLRSEKFQLSEYWIDPLYQNFTAAATDSGKVRVGIVLFPVYLAAAILIGVAVNRKKEL